MRVEKNAYRTPRYVFKWLERRLHGFIWTVVNEHNTLKHLWIGEGSSVATDFLADDLFDRLIHEAAEQGNSCEFSLIHHTVILCRLYNVRLS